VENLLMLNQMVASVGVVANGFSGWPMDAT
jgi:hypothetical protein